MKQDKIFIQIAAYRDPELVPTIKSILDNADNPENLVFCIAWQYEDKDDFNIQLDPYLNDNRFIIIEIPWKKSKGACWARNLIQQHYDEEEYTLQLDSHMRFVKSWDTKCKEMIKQLKSSGYKKPLLTGYMPSFTPGDDNSFTMEPWKMKFDRFIPEGAVFFLPETIDEWECLTEPVKARFYSAHFCFVEGIFCKEVPHDPNYYFHGEEISIAVRAFTHGYDLFHPHMLVCWHEYTRKGRTKHWDDHDTKNDLEPWYTVNERSHARNRCLFSMDGEKHDSVDWGIYDFGKDRTLKEYEDYAGINFELRLAQEFTINNIDYPPNPIVYKNSAQWEKECTKNYTVKILITEDIDTGDDITFWYVGVQNKNGDELQRRDFDRDFLDKIKEQKIDQEDLSCYTNDVPYQYVIWPFSKTKGWGEKIVRVI